jgi:hypothetical protein
MTDAGLMTADVEVYRILYALLVPIHSRFLTPFDVGI